MDKTQKVRRKPPDKLIKIIKSPLIHYALFGVLLIVFQLTGIFNISQMRSVGTTLIYAIASLGFCLLLGYSGQASLGTAGFMGLGSYIAFYFLSKTQMPLELILVIVAAASILAGAIIGFISLRIQGIFLAIITLGLSQILVNLFIALPEWTGGVNGGRLNSYPALFFNLIASNREVVFCVCAVILVLAMCMTHNLIKSPTGRAMLAMKNSTTAAQAYGIGLMKYRLLAFVLSTVFAGIAGMLYICYFRNSAPATWSLELSLYLLGAIIMGGTKSIWGAIGGVFLIYGFEGLVLQNIPFFGQNPTLIYLIVGALIIVIVMFFPGGIPQIIMEIITAIRKRYAKNKENKAGKALNE